MSQILASIEDINNFLPDMVEITDGEDAQYQVDTNRLVKSQLAGVYSATVLSGWADPSSTPGLIRAIAGRLIAARYYAVQFSQETTNIPQYAQNLYNESISMLADIRRGVIIVLDNSNNPISTGSALELALADVTPTTASGDPVFSMGIEFG